LANFPGDFASCYGDTCLVCLVMLGNHKRIYRTGSDPAFDTIIGNKGSAQSPHKDEVVVKGSSQCVPIFKIKADDMKDKEFMTFLSTIFKLWLQTFATKWFDLPSCSTDEYDPAASLASAASTTASTAFTSAAASTAAAAAASTARATPFISGHYHAGAAAPR